MAFPGHRRVMQALRHLDLLVTLELRETATTALSHITIACRTPYERPDIAVLTDGNSPFPAVQYTEPLTEASDQTVEEREVFHHLARRMGVSLNWKFKAFGLAHACPSVTLDAAQSPSAKSLFEVVCTRQDLPFDALKRSPGGQVFAPLPEHVQPADPASAGRLDLMPDDVAQELRQCWLTGQRQQLETGQFLLISRRLLNVLNSNFTERTEVQRSWPAPPLYMHSRDIEQMCLATGKSVTVRSDAGSISARLHADDGMRLGVVAMHHAWGRFSGEGLDMQIDSLPVGALIDAQSCVERINHVPRISAIPGWISA